MRGREDARFEKLAGSWVLDLRVEHRFDRATVYAEIANALDAEYNLFGIISRNVRGTDEEVERFLTPGLPRSLRVGMRLTAGQRLDEGRSWTFLVENDESIVLDHSAADEVTVAFDDGTEYNADNPPDPTNPENLLREHGRGLLLAKCFVDELNFNDAGNEVTVAERLDHDLIRARPEGLFLVLCLGVTGGDEDRKLRVLLTDSECLQQAREGLRSLRTGQT